MYLEKNGHRIKSIKDWRSFAPPKSKKHWVRGRSAFELARAWCGSGSPRMPQEIRELFESAKETRGLIVEKAFPEYCIKFDSYGGERRNADLAFVGKARLTKIAVTVEAKADEAFGETINKTLSAALERRLRNAKSRGVDRVIDLVQSLLSSHHKGQRHIGWLRYQLFTATAGSLAFAVSEGASVAVLLLHEFITDQTRDELHKRNATDLEEFLNRLAGPTVRQRTFAGLAGPYKVPGEPLFKNPPPLFVGKVCSNRRH